MARLSKEKRERLILVIILTIAISVGLWYGIITTRKERLAETKAAIRAAIDKLEKEKKISQDEQKRALDELEKLTHSETKKIEDLSAVKEKEILEVK